MTEVNDLIGEYAAPRNETRRHQIVEELVGHLPDPVAFGFVVGLLEDQSPGASLARVTVLRSLCLARLESPADRDRVAQLLAGIVRTASSSDERVHALTACRLMLDSPPVGDLLSDLLKNPPDKSTRLLAMNCLYAARPGNIPAYAFGLCHQLRNDPDLGATARDLLERWVTRIPVPEWAPRHARGEVEHYDGFTDEDRRALEPNREAILALVHDAVTNYLIRQARADRGEDHFPHADRLTGEYYIGSERYAREDPEDTEFRPRYKVRIGVRCIQRSRPPHVLRPSDYLGLDVLVFCDTWDGSKLSVWSTDSSVI